MAGFSFLHAADIHLDSGFSGLPALHPGAASLVADATRRAFSALVDTALARRVDFVVIAGDLYDGPARHVATALHVRDRLRRLADAGVPVFLVKGNHDAESEIADLDPPPPGLHVFPSARAGTVRLDALGVALHGRSFPERRVAEDFALGYPPPVAGLFNIGVLHTSADGRPPHAVYAPCSVAALRARGYDYWALGHVHAPETLSDDPPVVFPGCLQGRHIREAGEKGAVLVTVADGRPRLERLALDAVRWALVEPDLSGVETEAERRDAARAGLADARDAAGGRPVVARLRWRGASPLDGRLRAAGFGALLEEAQAIAADLSDTLVIEKVEVATLPPVAADPAALAPLAGALAAAVADPETRAAVEAAIAEVWARLRAEQGVDPPPRPDPAETLAAARRLLLARGAGLGTADGEGAS
jgi:hypothetical protein